MKTQKILLGFEPRKENLLPAIKEINRQTGLVDCDAISKIARYFDLFESEVFSVASFYDEIKVKRSPDFVIRVCDGANCNSKRGEQIIGQIENFFGQKIDDENNYKIKIERMSCQGLCLVGPIMRINEMQYEKVKPENVDDILRHYFE